MAILDLILMWLVGLHETQSPLEPFRGIEINPLG